MGHPVASVAARLCEAHVGPARAGLIGAVACGRCWEQAIRADERVAVLFDLPPVSPPQSCSAVLDEVAVEVAAAGARPVVLTEAERLAAVRLLLARGLTVTRIGERLRLSHAAAKALVAQVRSAAATAVA